jgi:hypothetical protein
MFELKWTDQDMIDFANSYGGINIDFSHLEEFTEDRKREAIQRRINTIVGMAAMDETLLEKLENVLKESTK